MARFTGILTIPPALMVARFFAKEQKATLSAQVQAEVERIMQQLANRVKELEERYAEL